MSTNTHTHSNVDAHLRGKLHKEVVICSKGADADTLADGRGQGFDLIETAVKLVQRCQPDAERRRRILIIWCYYYIYSAYQVKKVLI